MDWVTNALRFMAWLRLKEQIRLGGLRRESYCTSLDVEQVEQSSWVSFLELLCRVRLFLR